MENFGNLNYRMLATNHLAKGDYIEAIKCCLEDFKALGSPTDRDMYQISSVLIEAVVNHYKIYPTDLNEIYLELENRLLKAISMIAINGTDNLLKLKVYTFQDYFEWGSIKVKK